MTDQIRCQIRDEGLLCCFSDERALTFQAEIIFSSKPTMDETSLVLLLEGSIKFCYIMLSKCCLEPHLTTVTA